MSITSDQKANYKKWLTSSKQQLPITLPNFRVLRKRAGYTLRQVEEATGISNPYLSQLETGKVKNPSYMVVAALVNFYNILNG